MIEALLKGFISEEWIEHLDFASLHSLDTEHIVDDLSTRHDDVIWKIYCKDIPIYIICLIEFQTTVEKFMITRLLTYTGLIYQDLIAEKDPFITSQGKLPPIFPLVFYNGPTRWSAPLRLKDCLASSIPGSLKKYQPDFEYAVLDIGHLALDKYPARADNLVVPIIELETLCETDNALKIVNKIASLLKGREFDSLRRSMAQYIAKALKLHEICPGVTITNLQEVNTMLAENIERWKENWKQQGLQEGREKGLQEGRQEGRQEGFRQIQEAHLLKLLKAKSVPVTQQILTRIQNATLEELEHWFDQLLSTEIA